MKMLAYRRFHIVSGFVGFPQAFIGAIARVTCNQINGRFSPKAILDIYPHKVRILPQNPKYFDLTIGDYSLDIGV